jgi:hypothetical protein
MFISFYISDTFLSLASLLHSVGCDFPHPSKIDHFRYLTETKRPKIESIFTVMLSGCYCVIKLNEVMLNVPDVNFINILRARFLYKSSFKAKTYLEKAAETTFVWKIRMFNVDEIDTWTRMLTKNNGSQIFSIVFNSGIPFHWWDVHLFGVNPIKRNFVQKSQDLCIFYVTFISCSWDYDIYIRYQWSDTPVRATCVFFALSNFFFSL